MDCPVSLTESRFEKFVHRLGEKGCSKVPLILSFLKKLVITMSLNPF